MSAEQLNSSPNDQKILVATFRTSLGSDPELTKAMNVSIDLITDTTEEGRRLMNTREQAGQQLRVRLLSGVSITFKVVFNVDQQQFLNVDDGMNQTTTKFAADARSGQITRNLNANAEEGVLSTAVGATTMTYTAPIVTTFALLNPTMLPSVSPKPTVVSTTVPSTQKPTWLPSTTVPSYRPTGIKTVLF